MSQYEHHIWKLLTRILSEEADSSEKKEFKQWLEDDQANRTFFEELESRWKEEPDKNTLYNRFLFDRESGISRLRYKIREEEEKKVSRGFSPQVKKPKRFTGWKVAASILLLLGIVSAWVGIHSWSPSVTSYKTSNLEQRIITLPDGSNVRLNRNSTITFRKGLAGSTRKVTLKGEAFFKVKHNADKPFIIHAGNAVVRDIGTSFNVKQQNDGKIVVAMEEGKASLRTKNSNWRDASILTKNQVGILSNGQVSTIKQENIQNYVSWINGRLEFKDMQFDKVIRQLDNIYGIHSSLGDSSLSTLKLTAYTKNTSLAEVLHMIALSLNIDYRKEGNNIIWRKKRTQSKTQPEDITDTLTTKD